MKPIIKYSVFVVLALVLVLLTINKIADTEKQIKTNDNIQYVVSVMSSPLMQEVHKINNKAEVKIENKRYEIKDVKLDSEILDYIFQKANESKLSYELLLAIAKVESDFDQNLVSNTQDYGMYQIHRPTDKWISKELGLTNYNLKDSKTSVDFAVYYLNYLRHYWVDQGASEEEAFGLVVISYNRGIEGCRRYVRRYGMENNKYLRSVKHYKNTFEQNIM
jgi:soluble lytic murein transglycosylase-like protein